MGTTTVVDAARRALGPVGAFLPFSRSSAPSIDLQRDAVRRLAGADGAMPAMVPPEFIAEARQLLGPDKLLVVGLAVVVDADPGRAKQTARQRVAARLGQPGTYAATMARLGYSEREIAEVGDRLVDGLVGHGGAARIAAKVREHLAAGADHVMVMSTGTDDFTDGVDQLEQLAPTLAELTD